MSGANLNLARKWRSKNFDQIVGQELSVRMLKNSLYLDHYFPVYLFSGQRGCGKTTTARVFAAAINCEALSDFRKQPKISCVPCLQCSSCQAMLAGKHPDFIEIDAASHTGVDNVRQIVDASQLLPLMGEKKIYLIDEAHMLSKAAFNAFLKILEEPPSSVLFILATTDEQKIIDTVKSRCFQLFFKPVSHNPLLNHLKNVCDSEKILYEESALSLVIKETQGSVRDALNVLEQVRFARGSVTKEAVLHVLGHIDDEHMIELIGILLGKQPQELLTFLQTLRFDLFSAEFVWNKLAQLVRATIWVKYGVKPEWAFQYAKQLEAVANGCSIKRLNNVLKLLYENEAVFLKTTAKHSLLEMILLQICQKNLGGTGSGSAPVSQSVATPATEGPEDAEADDVEEVKDEEEEVKGGFSAPPSTWQQFLSALSQLNDPLLSSIFKNGSVLEYDQKSGVLTIEFAKKFAFFKETIEENSSLWLPHLQTTFGKNVSFNPQFTGQPKVELAVPKVQVAPVSNVKPQGATVHNGSQSVQRSHGGFKRSRGSASRSRATTSVVATGKLIDVSDAQVWKKAAMIARHFPGSFRELEETKS